MNFTCLQEIHVKWIALIENAWGSVLREIEGKENWLCFRVEHALNTNL